jgi:two-component system NtrC family sensor kinase
VRIHDLFASCELLDEFMVELEKIGFVEDYETKFKRRDNAEMDVLITATRREKEASAGGSYDCIIRNITQRKKMEQQLKQADRLASIGQLAAGVAHEINNPLSIVMGYTKLMKEEVPDEGLKEDLEVIYNNAAACKKIVEDLLNFSRQTKARLHPADIRETLESVVSVVEAKFSENNITIERDYDPQVPLATIDAGKIRQVCMNLIMNSRQAMSAGGLITVATRSDPAHGGFFITVADTGCGVSQAIRDRIFDPFFTTKEPGQGTGLGLTVSYGIIEEHGGTISFESEEGKGSIFKIWLPLEGGENETIGTHC